jgi:polysaccharide export outer membrane protein
MPVRSRGSLLAGTATLAGLLLVGVGCHSSPSDHDSFSMSGNGGQPANGQPSLGGTPVMMGMEPGQQAFRYVPSSSSAPASGPMRLQPVPAAQSPANNPTVIASSWQPVQRVSAEQPASGPELNGNALAPAAPPGAMAPGMISRVPAGDAPPVDPGNGVPPNGNTSLHAPRPLASSTQAPPLMVQDGPTPPPNGPHGPGDDVPREFDKQALPPYVVEPPDLLLIQASDRVTLSLQRIEGQHLVAPDGTINLGIYGTVRVAGLNLAQIADAVANRLLEIMPGLARGEVERDPETGKPEIDPKTKKTTPIKWGDRFSTIELIKKEMQVDVLSYNSKYYYVITDGGGYGQQVYPFLITGNETVLDALAKVNGIPAVGSKKKVWLARATRPGQAPKIMPVDWCGVAQRGQADTNYQLFPGDRVFVQSDAWIRTDTWLAKRLSPLLRGFGATLLGASTVNTIKLGSSGAGLGSALTGGAAIR